MEGEDGEVRVWTYAELRQETDRLARGLRALGVRASSTVGIFLPMAPETVAAVMACSKLGAIWVPIFSGFGADAVGARLADAGARVLLTANASLRKGKAVPMKETADRAAALAGCVERIVVWRRLPDVATPSIRRATSTGPASTTTRRSTPSRSTRSSRCSSATRAGRRAGRKASCTSTAASS